MKGKENWSIHLVSTLKEAFWRVSSAARGCRCSLMVKDTSGSSLMDSGVAAVSVSSTMGPLMRDPGRTTNVKVKVF